MKKGNSMKEKCPPEKQILKNLEKEIIPKTEENLKKS